MPINYYGRSKLRSQYSKPMEERKYPLYKPLRQPYRTKPKTVIKSANLRQPDILTLTNTPFLPVSKWCYNMPYHEVVTLTTNASPETATCLVWSMNGLFDPEIPIGGHQPMGFDQAMAFYDHYTVVRSSVTVTFNSSDSDNVIIAAGVYLSSSSTPITGSDSIVENGLLKRIILTSNINNTHNQNQIQYSVSLPKFFGKKNTRRR